jgi:hypothetical protein
MRVVTTNFSRPRGQAEIGNHPQHLSTPFVAKHKGLQTKLDKVEPEPVRLQHYGADLTVGNTCHSRTVNQSSSVRPTTTFNLVNEVPHIQPREWPFNLVNVYKPSNLVEAVSHTHAVYNIPNND